MESVLFDDDIGLSIDILNITNQTLKYYASTSLPRAFYSNGRQYYFKARLTF